MARQSNIARDNFVTSVPPPGGNGTFSVVGLLGHACACAGEVIAADDATTIAMKTLMLSPSLLEYYSRLASSRGTA
jgi:hypothetical protein